MLAEKADQLGKIGHRGNWYTSGILTQILFCNPEIAQVDPAVLAADEAKKLERAKRFGIVTEDSEKAKKQARTERFVEVVDPEEEAKRKARAERFAAAK